MVGVELEATQQFSVTLPIDVAEAVEGRIKSRPIFPPSEVLDDGVSALMERDSTLESWLRERSVAGHEAYLDDPLQGIPADVILSCIEAVPAS